MCKIFYLIRLDDASSKMDFHKWKKLETILGKHNIAPMVGVIPKNEDTGVIFSSQGEDFLSVLNSWIKKNWTIALHGYNHVYSSTSGGLNPVHKRSEFAGLSYQEQLYKITEGCNIMRSLGVVPKYFFAPSHTFDLNTMAALKANSINIISDTFALKPYTHEGIIFIPNQMGKFRKISIPGYWTFNFHPNNMSERDFTEFDAFIEKHRSRFIPFDKIPYTKVKNRSMLDKLLNKLYLTMRYVKQ